MSKKPIVLKNSFKNRPKPRATPKDRIQDKKIAKLESITGTRELKFQDVSAVATAMTWNGTIVNLFAPAQGSSDNQRLGDKVAVERVYFRINGGMTGAGANQVRVMIIRDKTNSIGTTVNRVLDNAALGTANAAQAPYEEDFRKNYEVYYDKTFMVDNVTHYQFQAKFGKTFKKPKPGLFDTNTTTMNKGQWKLLLISDQLAPNAAVDYYSRIWYSDI